MPGGRDKPNLEQFGRRVPTLVIGTDLIAEPLSAHA
jgi:hypothetical protein